MVSFDTAGLSGMADELKSRMDQRSYYIMRAIEDLYSMLQAMWVQVVQYAATSANPAPRGQIIAQAGEIGWRVWRSREGSERRYQPIRDEFAARMREVLRAAFEEAVA